MTQSATTQAIEILKFQAEASPASKAVFIALALRTRARNVMTLKALTQKMESEGFRHNAEEYAPVLKAMAQVGFGTLVLDNKGRVKALKDIKVKLMDIGNAVVGDKTAVGQFKQKNRFVRLPKAPVLVEKRVLDANPAAIAPNGPVAFLERRKAVVDTTTPVSLTVRLKGVNSPISIPVTKEMSKDDLASIIAKFA